MFRILTVAVLLLLAAGIAVSQFSSTRYAPGERYDDAEFQPVRVVYRTFGGAGSRGYSNPWWAIDYPDAEIHFLPALNRLTNISVSEDSRHLMLTDENLWEHPFLFLQQPGQGRWAPTEEEAIQLREYMARGGFMLVDDFHGTYDWAVFEDSMRFVYPERAVERIPEEDSLMQVFYNLGDRVQIPGKRHVYGYGGQTYVQMEGPPEWLAVRDEEGRIKIGINYNIDMGDAWEHADDPAYPAEMTGQAYRLGVNYVIYAMTH